MVDAWLAKRAFSVLGSLAQNLSHGLGSSCILVHTPAAAVSLANLAKMAYLLAAISNDMRTAEKGLGKRAVSSISHPQRDAAGARQKVSGY